jgi:hypothetical protein
MGDQEPAMISNLLHDARIVPESVRATGDRIRSELDQTAEKLDARRQAARRWIKRSAFLAGTRGADRLWQLHLDALHGAEVLLDKAPVSPLVEKVTTNVREALSNLEGITTRPPIEGYDDLNVREIRQALHDLDHLGLLRLKRHEQTHKARKTVLDAVDREFEHRVRVAGG